MVRHGNVRQGGGAVNQAAEVGGVAGKHDDGLPGLRETSVYGDSV